MLLLKLNLASVFVIIYNQKLEWITLIENNQEISTSKGMSILRTNISMCLFTFYNEYITPNKFEVQDKFNSSSHGSHDRSISI